MTGFSVVAEDVPGATMTFYQKFGSGKNSSLPSVAQPDPSSAASLASTSLPLQVSAF